MRKLAEKITAHRGRILSGILLLCAVCAFLALKVPINADMTKYLPDDSSMKQGMDILQEELGSLQMPQTIRLMIEDLEEDEKEVLREQAAQIPGVDSAVLTDEKENLTLYTVSTSYLYGSSQEQAIEKALKALGDAEHKATVCNDETTGMRIPLLVYVLAIVILLIVMFTMCGSWTEPFLFLAAIGIAIVINMGTNIVLGSVSQTTYSISAILQLVLSMDYSVILMNRYRQEKSRGTGSAVRAAGSAARTAASGEPGAGSAARTAGFEAQMSARDAEDSEDRLAPAPHASKEEAMTEAWLKAFSSISSSGFTTLVGLLMLIFMRFKIGKDLGLVLAKGVFLSMVCVLTFLPGLILQFDGLIEKTRKKALHIPVGALAKFGYRFRYALTIGFVLLFLGCGYLQTLSENTYALSTDDPIAEIFPTPNPIILLYPSGAEEPAAQLAESLEEKEGVAQVLAYSTTIGRQMTPEELADYVKEMASQAGSFSAVLGEMDLSGLEDQIASLDAGSLQLIYTFYGLQNGGTAPETLSIEELFAFLEKNLDNPLIGGLIGEERKDQIREMGQMLGEVGQMLRGDTNSIMMINTFLPVEGEETQAILEQIQEFCSDQMEGSHYLIGNSPMAYEMKAGFGREFLTISLLTAGAVFLVVLVTFRQLILPVLLVLLVQCGVFMTIMTSFVIGYRMYYLAVIILQCILMGATVDYGILFANYYRELRAVYPADQVLYPVFERSIHTILTSSMFMIFVTGTIGFSPVDQTIAQICRCIALGALSAVILVLFILPGLLAAADKLVKRP